MLSIPENVEWLLFAILTLGIKFFVYAKYANLLNEWFGKTHNMYKVSAVRIALSIGFAGINQLLVLNTETKIFAVEVQGVFTSFIFAILAWYILFKIFYATEHSKWKALTIGVILSLLLAALMYFVGFFVALSTINFC
jgi:hypothetical protein